MAFYKDNIVFTKTGIITEMRRLVHFLLNNLKLREKIGNNGRRLIIDHFNMINMKNKLLESFEDKY